MAERNKVKTEKCFPEYKKFRNKVFLGSFFEGGGGGGRMLIERDNNIASVWRALNVFTKGYRSTSADISKNLTQMFSIIISCLCQSH